MRPVSAPGAAVWLLNLDARPFMGTVLVKAWPEGAQATRGLAEWERVFTRRVRTDAAA